MRILRVTAGLGLILFSFLAGALSVVAIIDPAGTKMADDNDPFGPPPTRLSSAGMLSIFIVTGAAGAYLVGRPPSRRDTAASEPNR
jgi:hypothetical protein